YFSAGSFENWRPDSNIFPQSVIGKQLVGWPGEYWLDSESQPLRFHGPIMQSRMALGSDKGCDGFDPDNVDAFAQTGTGWTISVAHQLTFNRFLADTAHSMGKLVALKNCLDLIPELYPYFDFAVVEQCAQYNECDLASPFVSAGKAVFEYVCLHGSPSSSAQSEDLTHNPSTKHRIFK
ncbi:glycoside hydrolase family 114 protein, partial [Gonapodya prolifera JEL478]